MSANTNTKAMEEALQIAVARMNRSETTGGTSAPMDPLGLLAAVLPKFLENKGGGDDVLEKIEGLHTEDLLPLREELRLARQQIHRLRKAQEEMMAILLQLTEQQTAVGDAVLDLAKQMARIEFVDPVLDDGDGYETLRRSVQVPSAPRRAGMPSSKANQKVRKTPRNGQS